jgi:hypothetical protein
MNKLNFEKDNLGPNNKTSDDIQLAEEDLIDENEENPNF